MLNVGLLKYLQIPNIPSGIIASAGIWLFACFIHTIPGFAVSGLILTSFSIVFNTNGFTSLFEITGLSVYKKKLFPFALIGILLGTSLGMLNGFVERGPLIPISLKTAAIIAPLVGIAEELLFRGFIQGTFSKTSAWAGIIIASVSHTIYKLLVIVTYPDELGINMFYMAILTFSAGLLIGWLRKASESLIPSALAHGCFDIVLYGGLTVLPVWVWG
jgi:membrane protease YdiL (CAAX protease family)